MSTNKIMIVSINKLTSQLRQRINNLIYLLNSNDIPQTARIDITRTCIYSISSTLNQLLKYYEQKNRKN